MLARSALSVATNYVTCRVESGQICGLTLDSGQRMFTKIGVQEPFPQKSVHKSAGYHMGKMCQNRPLLGGILAGRVGPGRRLRLLELRFNNARASRGKIP